MEDSEPTFSTEPSSRAIRARASTWVFTRSCQSTAVFADAVMVFPLRAMLTAGITRETSPARCPAAWGAAQTSAGIAISNESSSASPKAYGDFVFIEDSPDLAACIYRTYWRVPGLSTPNKEPLAHSLHVLVGTSADNHSIAKMKHCRSHVVVLLLPLREILNRLKDAAEQFGRRIGPRRGAEFLQPLDSELFSAAVKCIRNPIRAEEHRIARTQAHRQSFVARTFEQTRGNPRELQRAAAFRTEMKGARHAGASDMQYVAARIEYCILNGCVPPGHAADHEPPVERGERIAGRCARFVHPSQCTHR